MMMMTTPTTMMITPDVYLLPEIPITIRRWI